MQAYGEGFTLYEQRDKIRSGLASGGGDMARRQRCPVMAARPDRRGACKNPDLEGIAAYVPDSGEGRSDRQEAMDLNITAPVITLALLQRLQSRDPESFSNKLL